VILQVPVSSNNEHRRPTSFQNPSLGLLVLDRNFADVGVLEGTYPDVDHHFEDVAEFGFELKVDIGV
jgi:hypothetical protein